MVCTGYGCGNTFRYRERGLQDSDSHPKYYNNPHSVELKGGLPTGYPFHILKEGKGPPRYRKQPRELAGTIGQRACRLAEFRPKNVQMA